MAKKESVVLNAAFGDYIIVFSLSTRHEYVPKKLEAYLRKRLGHGIRVTRSKFKNPRFTIEYVQGHSFVIDDIVEIVVALDARVSEAKVQYDLLSMLSE